MLCATVSKLGHLGLSRNPLGDEGVRGLASCFSQAPFLRHVNLTQVGTDAGEGAHSLSAHVVDYLACEMERWMWLDTLLMASNRIGDEGLSAFMPLLKFMRRLRYLCLGSNACTDVALDAAKPYLLELPNLHVSWYAHESICHSTLMLLCS